MTNEKIYIIVGSTGEHSDYSEWIVKAFLNKNEANEFLLLLNDYSMNLLTQLNFIAENNTSKYWEFIRNAKIDLDPNFKMDYTGTTYNIVETELI
jgi:hypothetical protein